MTGKCSRGERAKEGLKEEEELARKRDMTKEMKKARGNKRIPGKGTMQRETNKRCLNLREKLSNTKISIRIMQEDAEQ